ncbi:hypothetical protein AVEN_254000-1 [Araneus ventricosus]|uniref:Uncharacterized protein n=1 Tax=Araneus ventricosus TaxID=182803 RepID=A0A4Y2E5S5_ARAVE|nr:hypothetical protein AVEN_254000-1 [Araneus ventricosus]
MLTSSIRPDGAQIAWCTNLETGVSFQVMSSSSDYGSGEIGIPRCTPRSSYFNPEGITHEIKDINTTVNYSFNPARTWGLMSL